MTRAGENRIGGKTTRDDKPLLTGLTEWLRSLTGSGDRIASLRESVEELIDEHPEANTADDAQERTMLRNLLSFGEKRVEDVMVPRADIVAVPASAELAGIIAVMAREGHSRLPVFQESLDEIVGMVHVRDLLTYWKSDKTFNIDAVKRTVPFIPGSKPVHTLLLEMRATKRHMALVVDEHGGVDGLVTIEDLVEEIVGEIEDEHDRSTPPVLSERPDGALDAPARLSVESLEQRLAVDLLPAERDEQIDTIGGLIFALAERVPQAGEVIRHQYGLAFEILEADPRRIRRVRIWPAGAEHAPPETPAAP